ncbi:hypothetical protein Tco_1203729 [Tanacetum coccineum]
MSSECNNIKLVIRNDKSEVVCAMCKKCLITSNHDVCVLKYVNDMNSCGDKHSANVSKTANKKKHMSKGKKPKNVGFKERLALLKPSKPIIFLRWSPTRRMFDLKGKIIESSKSKSQSDSSKGEMHVLLTIRNLHANGFQILTFLWQVVQIYLWCVDSGFLKHMTGNLKLFIDFVWKFLGTVRFGNDHITAILGYYDLQWGNILITRVYSVKGLGHNLFSVGQFCDSDLKVAFERNTCFVRNLKGLNLLKGNRTTNRYTINLYEMASASPIRLTAHTSTKSKDEALEEIKTFMKKINVLLQALVIIVRTDNSTELKNQVLKEYFDSVGISHQAMYDDYIGGQPSDAPRTAPTTLAPQVLQTLTTSTTTADTAPTSTNSTSQAADIPITLQDVDKLEPPQQHVQQQDNQALLQPKNVANNVLNAMLDGNTFVNPFAPPSISAAESSSL